MNRILSRLGLMSLALAAGPMLLAQSSTISTTGTITGTVRGTDGTLIAGATLQLSSGQLRRSAVSGADGTYRIGLLEPRVWSVTVSKGGFQSFQSSVTVTAHEVQVVNVKLAQESGTTVVVEAEPAYVVQVASTGTKTDTPILQTPVSIQVIPEQVLQDQKATTLERVLKNVSGVKANIQNGFFDAPTLRGFGTNTTFRDGFRMDTYSITGPVTMTNVESVEVLKGPAAILYGRVEPGGMVNLVIKKPLAEAAYSFEEILGSWNRTTTNLDATGPVNEGRTLLYRVSASYDQGDSWRDDMHDKKLFIAPTLKWLISPQTQVTLEVQRAQHTLPLDYGSVPYDASTGQFVWIPGRNNLMEDAPMQVNSTFIGLSWSHQFNDSWAIRQQNVYFTTRMNPAKGYFFDPSSGFTQVGASWEFARIMDHPEGGNTTLATILDLTGHFQTGGLKHTLLVGADFYRYDSPFKNTVSTTDSMIDAFNPVHPGTPSPIDPNAFGDSSGRNTNYGVYIQDQIELPHDVHLLMGLRGQRVTHEGWSVTGTSFGGDGSRVPDVPSNDKALTPRVGLLWQPVPTVSLYTNYAENFGANTGRSWDFQPLKPESAKQVEVGAKAVFFGGRLKSSLALYDLAKTNVAVNDLLHPGYSVTVGQITSKGTELDILGELRPGWNLILTHAYTDIRVTKSTPDSYYVVGNRLENVPRTMASLSTTYAFQGDRLRGWKIGGGLAQRGPSVNHENTIITPGYTLFDAMIAYDFKVGASRVTAQVNIDNLTNKSYYQDLTAYADYNWGILAWGTPRSVKVSMKIAF